MAFRTVTGKADVPRRPRGFTLIELLVVLSIIAVLLTIAVPRYFRHVDLSREAVLREDLQTMRDAIDKFYADTGAWPGTLDDLVKKGYLRAIPEDPLTGKRSSWRTQLPPNPGETGVYDVKSGATGTAADGSRYDQW